jgi:hypothetical protein
MLAVSPTATELPSSAEKLGVIEQVRSPTVMEAGETPVTVPVFCADGTPVVVALVVTVVVPPDVEVAEEEEDEDTEEDDDENEEEDEEAADDETLTDPALPGAPEDEMLVGAEAGLIVLSTPCRHEIIANCRAEKPDTETCGPTRHAR